MKPTIHFKSRLAQALVISGATLLQACGGGGGGGNVKIVNAFDVGDAVSKGMETKAGERAVLNLVRNNPRAFRAAMGN